MSWQKYSIRLTMPLILGTPLWLPVTAYAINIGETYVQSQPNQPLNATINVSDIDPATFAVSVADGNAYQQLGLSKDVPVTVRFVKTSSNGGKIVLTSKQPLTAPFADVVLDIKNQGETKLLPKTLLMPLDKTQKVTVQPASKMVDAEPNKVTVNNDNSVSLPVIDNPLPVANADNTTTANNTDGINTKTLVITEVRRPLGQTLATTATATTTPAFVVPPEPTKAPTTDNASNTSATNYVVQRNDNLWKIASRVAKQNNTDVNTAMKHIMAANPDSFPNNKPRPLTTNTTLVLPSYDVLHSPSSIKAANDLKQQTKTPEAETKTNQTKKTTSTKQATPTTKTVAKKSTVKQRTTKTPSAKATRATRKVARSTAKRKAYLPTIKRTTKATRKTPTPNRMSQASRPVMAQKPVNTVRKTEMKIIAPSKANGSAQGDPKANGNSTANGGGVNAQLVAQVQQKRLATAQKATKVNQLNQNLASAEKRLKLQNAKLAQLEQHLKDLKKK